MSVPVVMFTRQHLEAQVRELHVIADLISVSWPTYAERLRGVATAIDPNPTKETQ